MARDRRLLELALKGLEAERERIGYEIAEIRARLGGKIARKKRKRVARDFRKTVARKKRRVSKKITRKVATAKKTVRKKMSASQRKLISEKMKAAWARRKQAQGK